MEGIRDLLLLPFRLCLRAVSGAWFSTVSTVDGLRWLLVDWGWIPHVEAASVFAVTHLTKPILSTVIFFILLTLSLASSASVYVAFYQFYIPQTYHTFPVYLDFRYTAGPLLYTR